MTALATGIVPPQRCKYQPCGQLFTPNKYRAQSFCSKRCGILFQALQRKGALPASLVAYNRLKRQRARARVEQSARQVFGVLSDREVNIFNFAAKSGYDHGYNTGYHERARKAEDHG